MDRGGLQLRVGGGCAASSYDERNPRIDPFAEGKQVGPGGPEHVIARHRQQDGVRIHGLTGTPQVLEGHLRTENGDAGAPQGERVPDGEQAELVPFRRQARPQDAGRPGRDWRGRPRRPASAHDAGRPWSRHARWLCCRGPASRARRSGSASRPAPRGWPPPWASRQRLRQAACAGPARRRTGRHRQFDLTTGPPAGQRHAAAVAVRGRWAEPRSRLARPGAPPFPCRGSRQSFARHRGAFEQRAAPSGLRFHTGGGRPGRAWDAGARSGVPRSGAAATRTRSAGRSSRSCRAGQAPRFRQAAAGASRSFRSVSWG